MKKNISEKILKSNIKEAKDYWKDILLPKVEDIQIYNGDIKVVSTTQKIKFENERTYTSTINHKIINKLLDWYVTTEYYKCENNSCSIRIKNGAWMLIYFKNIDDEIRWIEVTNHNKGLKLNKMMNDQKQEEEIVEF